MMLNMKSNFLTTKGKTMRLERSTDDCGSGIGITKHESDMFRVVIWGLSRGVQTVIECKMSGKQIRFNGKIDFISDDDCMEQLSSHEVADMIYKQKEISFTEGMSAKASQIRDCLEM